MKIDIALRVTNTNNSEIFTEVVFPGCNHEVAMKLQNDPFIASLVKEHIKNNFIAEDGSTFQERLKALKEEIMKI